MTFIELHDLILSMPNVAIQTTFGYLESTHLFVKKQRDIIDSKPVDNECKESKRRLQLLVANYDNWQKFDAGRKYLKQMER